jgi:hypothetical protein
MPRSRRRRSRKTRSRHQSRVLVPESLDRTEEDAASAESADDPAHLPDFAELAQSSLERVERLAAELQASMSPYDAFDIVANLGFSNTPLNANTYKESTEPGLFAAIEYGALICLARDSRPGGDPEKDLIDGPTISDWDGKIRSILTGSLFQRVKEMPAPEDSAAVSIRQTIAGRELYVRNPAYVDQELNTIRQLFGGEQIDQDLRVAVGFGIEDAITITHALIDWPQGIMAVLSEQARREGAALLRAVTEARRGRSAGTDDSVDLIARLGTLAPGEAKKVVRNMAIAALFASVGTSLSFRLNELVEISDCSTEIVSKYLAFFSIGFGQKFNPVASGVNAVRDRPILRDADGNYLCSVVSNLLFGLRPRLTAALRMHAADTEDPAIWERFNRRRKAYVEQESVSLIGKAVRADKVWANLSFERAGRRYELDGLLTVGSVALVVEAKAGTLTAPSRRGAPMGLKRDLKELVVSATEQLARLDELFAEGETVEFIDPQRNVVAIDLSKVERVLLIAVTLEDLSWIGPTIWQLTDAGLLSTERRLPWLVNLHDLQIIVELTEIPAMFVHYLIRRSRLNALQLVHTMDELDLFVHYLERGLVFRADSFGGMLPDAVFLQSQTDGLDAYFMWKNGERTKPAKKPSQRMHHRFRRLLAFLDTERPPRFVEASVLLLDSDGGTRELIASTLGQLERRSRQDGLFHDMSLTFSDDDGPYGLTLMSGPAGQTDELVKRLRLYCMAKKYQTRSLRWLGLGLTAGASGGPVQGVWYQAAKWSQSDALGSLVSEIGLTDPGSSTIKEAKSKAQRRTRPIPPGEGS